MNINRRTFITDTGKTLIILFGANLLSACSSTVRQQFSKESLDNRNLSKIIGDDYINILYYASLAPSGHNTQPWVVRIEGKQRWIIGSAQERWLPAVDPNNRELLLSIGAFLENLIAAAKYYGYEIEYKVIAENSSSLDIFEVSLKKISPNTEIDLTKLKTRRTIRNGHRSQEIKTDDIEFITQNIKESRYIPKGTSDAKYLAQGTIEANKIQAYREPAQKELSDWIRWSNSSAKKYMNGLTPASMGINGIAGWYVRNFYDRNSVLSNDFRERTIEVVKKQVKNCGGWIVISSNDYSTESLIETGRYFERMFLRLKEKSIALHPMSQILEESPWVNNISNEIGKNIQFILRVGYIDKYPNPVSLRMPLSRFTKVRLQGEM